MTKTAPHPIDDAACVEAERHWTSAAGGHRAGFTFGARWAVDRVTVDDLAQIVDEHRIVVLPHVGRNRRQFVCACGSWPYDERDADTEGAHAEHVAALLREHVRGERA
jgi:hypothetical protein